MPCITKLSHDREITLELKADNNDDIIVISLSPKTIDYLNYIVFRTKDKS